jgi:hypothetical protein
LQECQAGSGHVSSVVSSWVSHVRSWGEVYSNILGHHWW